MFDFLFFSVIRRLNRRIQFDKGLDSPVHSSMPSDLIRGPANDKLLEVLFIVLISFGFVGCQSVPVTTNSSWETKQKHLTQLNQWQLQAKIGLRMPNKAHGLLIDWQQKNAYYSIQLSSALGQTVADIQGNFSTPDILSSNVTVTTQENKVYTGNNPELLIQQYFDWNIPVSYLFYWIRGIPAPTTLEQFSFNLDSSQRLVQLNQAGWSITYERYINIEGFDLPQKLILWNNEFKLTLLVKEWDLYAL